MGRQIRFFFCDTMRDAIECEARRLRATLVDHGAWGTQAIEFSRPFDADTREGRLWTEAADPTHYESLCRAVKRGASYHRESGLWVKKACRPIFESYWAAKQKALEELVERNRKYAVEVLGARIVSKET